MLDLTLLANPARLKREFLRVTEVGVEAMPPELKAEFEQMKQESPQLLVSGSFWWDFVRTYKKQISLLIVGRAAMTVLILAAVLISQRILDETNSMIAAIWLLVFYSMILLVRTVINAWTALLQSQLLVCTRTFVTLRVNVKLLGMGQLSSDDFSTGNLKTLVSSDIYRIADLFQSVARNAVPCILALIFLGPLIVFYMGIPGILAILVGFCAMPLAFFLGQYVHRKEALIKAEEDALSTIIGEWVTNVRLLRFLGWEKLMQGRVASHVRQLVIQATRQHGVNLINFGVSFSWWLFPIITLVWANGYWGQSDDLLALFASIWMLNHITLYIRWLPAIFIDYASASACVERLETLFQHRSISDDLMPDYPVSVETAMPISIRLNQVGFGYAANVSSASPLVINDISLTLNLRQQVSLIGRVGAGKSTLLKLLCAEIKPTSGTIQVEFDNGVVANLWHKNIYRRYRASVGYMPQEAYLSNTSLEVNVALATDQSESDVMRAIQMAELEADIVHWQSGLKEEVGETGVNLSGGQKQRVNLARALFSRRPFLVLDDPLSAVDTATEAALMENLRRIPRGFILCSHRLNELQQTDRLLVIDAGRIVEDGDPNALMTDPDSEFNQHLKAGDFLLKELTAEAQLLDSVLGQVEEEGSNES